MRKLVAIALACTIALPGCAAAHSTNPAPARASSESMEASDVLLDDSQLEDDATSEKPEPDAIQEPDIPNADDLRASLQITEDYRASFDHGPKDAGHQRYIVLHDTEGEGDAASVINYWDASGNAVAAHFVVNKDGGIWQCVPLDRIAHHAGFGDTGHNVQYGIAEDGRDDRIGTTPIGSWASDYGMNAWSVGIELVHVGGSGYYPEEQLIALDGLIAYIDAYYGFESDIIDHKAWRSGNSDTSPEFATYLANYQDHRRHE